MTPLARSSEPTASVCAYHDDLMELLRDVRQDQKATLVKMMEVDKNLSDHIARHLERERLEARGINWPRIQEVFITGVGLGLLTLILLYALLHAREVLRFFGGGG